MKKETEANVTAMVLEVQAGNAAVWTDLYLELTEHKKASVKQLKATSMGGFGLHEIDAFYDETLMETVETFDPHKSSGNYVSYLWMVLKLRVGTLMKSRVGLQESFELSTKALETNSDSNHSEHELIPDSHSQAEFTEVTDFSYFEEVFAAYVATDKKGRVENCKLLLAQIEGHNLLDADRQEVILKALPEGTTWASARKKLQRAREDFESFLANY